MSQHLEFQEQIPFYALGELSAEESARLSAHLQVCGDCRALLNNYEFVADELLLNVPPQTAPAHIGIHLQNLAEMDAKRQKANAKPQNEPPRSRLWNQRVAMPRWAFALALVAFLLTVAMLGALLVQAQQRDAAAQQVMGLLQARNLKFVELTRANGKDTNSGFLCVVSDNSTALLWLYGMDPLDSEHVYQVWLRDGDVRHDGGIFRADGDGRAIAVIQAPRPLSEYTEIGVTVEPASGSFAPTTPRIVGGKLD